jgi:uncharacterized membrane protein
MLATRLRLTAADVDTILATTDELGRMLQALRKTLDLNATRQETRPNR